VIARLDVRQAALPAMHWLLDDIRETVHLSVLDGEQVMCIDKLDSPEPVRAYSEIGRKAPAYCIATGKVLLAWRELYQPSLHLVNSKREAFTAATITNVAEMVKKLARIRSQGYAVNRGEWGASVWGWLRQLRTVPVEPWQRLVCPGLQGGSSRPVFVQWQKK